jgi:type II secretory pathway pseudopilin PulG
MFQIDLRVNQCRQREQGITLVETMVSLLIFLAVLAGIVPAYVSYRLKSIQNPVRLGAVSVSQQILDEIREVRDVNALPNDGVVKTTATPSTPTLPALPALRRNTDLTNLTAYGKNYSAQVIYCETIPVDKSNYCSVNARYIHVLVFQKFSNGSVSTNPVYEVSTIYTKFEQ